jgi:surface antigen
LLATEVRKKSGGRLLSLALLGGITLSTSAGAVNADTHTQPEPRFTWLTLSGQWFCRSWSGHRGEGIPSDVAWGVDMTAGRAAAEDGDTTARCTTSWHVDASGGLISDDANWVSDPSGEWPAVDDTTSVPRPHTQVIVVTRHTAQKVLRRASTGGRSGAAGSNSGTSSSSGGTWSSGAYGAWTPVPGHPSYGMSDFKGDPYAGYFGVCTWYAWYRHRSEPLLKLGMASSWPRNAPAHGLSVGSVPRVGATAVFQPGVQGAGGGGHVGHVEQILSGGWFIISEMNFAWNGGGWGRVDWRYVHVGSGVSFIY